MYNVELFDANGNPLDLMFAGRTVTLSPSLMFGFAYRPLQLGGSHCSKSATVLSAVHIFGTLVVDFCAGRGARGMD